MADTIHCVGCKDNFYNGNNPYGIEKCWGLRAMRLDRYILIRIDERPPYLNRELQELPVCYKKEHYVKVKPESLTPEGYWR